MEKNSLVKRLLAKLGGKFKEEKSLNQLTKQVQDVLHPKYPSKINFDSIKKQLKEGTFDPKSVRNRK